MFSLKFLNKLEWISKKTNGLKNVKAIGQIFFFSKFNIIMIIK